MSIDEQMFFYAVRNNWNRLRLAAKELLADVRERHPGEELTCPKMRALDHAVKEWRE